MRRMYSQAELSAIIKEVFLEDVASGEIDLPALVTEALPEVDYSFEQDIPAFALTGATIEVSYGKIVQYGKLLIIDYCFNILAGENNLSDSRIDINFNLPEEVANNIFDVDGHSVHESSTSPITGLDMTKATAKGYVPSITGAILTNSSTADRMILSFLTGSISANAHPYYEIRLILTL